MTLTVLPGYYIKSGWCSQSELYQNGVRVDQLPKQADMGNGRRWQNPASTANVVTPAKFVDSVTGQRFAYGGLNFVWPMQGLSPNMVAYLQSTYFPSSGSNFFTKSWSNKLTVQTHNRATGNWEAYWVYARFTNFSSDAETALGGYNNMQIQFTAYRAAPEGPDLDATITTLPDLFYEGENYTFSSFFNNVGDSATFDDSVMTMTIPTNFVFVDITSPLDVDFEYSTNGITYTSTPPGDLTTVTHVRATYTSSIPASTTAGVVYLEVTAGTPIVDSEWVVTVSTLGDTDATNNSLTSTLTIVEWSPLALSNLRLWLDSSVGLWQDTAATVPADTDGETVQRWDDQSGSDNHVTGIPGGDDPNVDPEPDGNPGVFRPVGTDGSLLPFIEFDATTFYRTEAIALTSSAQTFVVVYDPDHDDTWGTVESLGKISGNDNVNSLYFAHIDNNQSPTDYRDSTAISSTGQTDAWGRFSLSTSGLQYGYFVNVTGASGRRYYRNGSLSGTPLSGTQFPVNGYVWVGGAWGEYSTDPSAYSVPSFVGKMYEVIWYNRELTSGELSRLSAYLSAKYGV